MDNICLPSLTSLCEPALMSPLLSFSNKEQRLGLDLLRPTLTEGTEWSPRRRPCTQCEA